MDEIMKIKLEMCSLGWQVEERITRDGWKNSTGYIIWFKRSDWHGKLTYSITGREVFFLGAYEDVSNYDAVLATIKRTAETAKKAWTDFPNTIPFQNANGEVKEDVMYCDFSNGKDVKNKVVSIQ